MNSRFAPGAAPRASFGDRAARPRAGSSGAPATEWSSNKIRTRRLAGLSVGLLAFALAATGAAQAQPAAPDPVYAITYFEVSPSAIANTAATAGQYAETSRKEPGNVGFEAFEEMGRPSRFATLEAWRDKMAAATHAASASAHGFAEQLRPVLVGPFEIRTFGGLSVVAPKGQGDRQAVWVLTHVDVFPAGKDQAVALVSALAEAGRKDEGNLRFDVLQQQGHANHFALVEAWADSKAFEASLMSAPTRNFREKLTPLEGALYDERLYRVLR